MLQPVRTKFRKALKEEYMVKLPGYNPELWTIRLKSYST